MKAVVALAGEVEDSPLVRRWLERAGLVVAADRGALRLEALGLRPDVVIGDLDSLSEEQVAALRAAGVEIAPHPAPQERTDGDVALLLARERGASEIVLLGASGGDRWDHGLANVLYAAALRAVSVTIVQGRTEAAVLRGDGRRSVRFRGGTGEPVSIIPISTAVRGVTTSGLRYRLRSATLEFGSSRGLSNVLAGTEGGYEIAEGVAIATHIATNIATQQGASS